MAESCSISNNGRKMILLMRGREIKTMWTVRPADTWHKRLGLWQTGFKPLQRLLYAATAWFVLLNFDSPLSTSFAQGTAFTYQGRLDDGGSPANGFYDLCFKVFDSRTNGNQQGPILTNAAAAVSNGLFMLTLDFGNQFPGGDRWLEIAIRTNGGNDFITLSPRQPLTPAPYAITAANVLAGGIPAGVYTNAVIFSNPGNQFAGNGSGLTNLGFSGLSGAAQAQITNAAVGALVAAGLVTNNGLASIYNRPQLTGVALWADPFLITATNNQPLAFVPDTSGNGNTLFNGTPNEVPYYTAGINGWPGFGFPATYDGTYSLTAFALTNQLWTPAMNTNSCITMVFKDNLENAIPAAYLFAAGTNLTDVVIAYDVAHSGGSLYIYSALQTRQNLQGGHLPYVFSMRINNGLADFWFNGAPTIPTFHSGPVSANGLGNSLVFGNAIDGDQLISESEYARGAVSGVMGDIIVHTNPPSDYELSNLQNFLLRKYGIGGGVEVILEGANQMQGAYSSPGGNMLQILQRAMPGAFLQSVSISGQTIAAQLSSESNWCHYAVPGTAAKKIVVEWWGERDLQIGTPWSVFTNGCIASVNLLHSSGMEVVGCTLVSDTNEFGQTFTRSNANYFIKNSGIYDYVCDFAADPDMGRNGAYTNWSFFTYNSVYAFLNSQGYTLLANRWLIPLLKQVINGGAVAATNGSFAGNWTNKLTFPVAVVMTNSTATAVFNASGVNVIPANANPASFTVGVGGWLTNASGGGFYYSTQ